MQPKPKDPQKEQSLRFAEEVEKLIKSGDIEPEEADLLFEKALSWVKNKTKD